MSLILVFFLILQPVPKDLPNLTPVGWRALTEEEVLAVASYFPKNIYTASVIALMCCEQPAKGKFLLRFPDNNSIGLHPWRDRYPYGWGNYWKLADIRPSGYFFAREGMTGEYKPYLAFSYFYDCFKFTYVVVFSRGIINGGVYRQRWVGRPGYNRRFDLKRNYFLLKLKEMR